MGDTIGGRQKTHMLKLKINLQEINISHLGKRNIIFKSDLGGGYVSSQEGTPFKSLQFWGSMLLFGSVAARLSLRHIQFPSISPEVQSMVDRKCFVGIAEGDLSLFEISRVEEDRYINPFYLNIFCACKAAVPTMRVRSLLFWFGPDTILAHVSHLFGQELNCQDLNHIFGHMFNISHHRIGARRAPPS